MPETATSEWGDLYRRSRKGFARLMRSRRLAFILAASAILSGVATFGLLTGTSTGTGTPDPAKLQVLLITDLVILLLLAAVIAQRVVGMWVQRRRGMAGSALHVRMVVMFSLLAVTPAILVTVFAALFLNFGFNSWFSERVRTAVDASQAVASAYFEEHIQNIRVDVLAIANDLNRDAALLSANPRLLSRTLSKYSAERNLTEASVLDGTGQVMARSSYAMLSLDVGGAMPPGAVDRADQGELVILTAPNADQVRAVVKLERYISAYLLVGRFVDAQVLSNMESVREASQTYLRLEESSGKIQITFVAIFAMVSLLLLLAAVWIGMALANQMARPISRLIEAAEQISGGNLQTRVEVDDTIGEVGTLSKAFNDMTGQLATQQEGMMQMNRKLDERRRFTETVLAGVSAGVVGLDGEGRINLPNRSASLLLGADLKEARGRHLAQQAPEMAEVLAEAMDRPDRVAQAEITIARDGHARTLIASVAAEQLDGDIIGYVLTFDDITELQSAQRKAAWSGVARRIAHEIKNPLTPIQLAAERLKRKYLKQIKDDPETFTICTETIIRQVEDIGRMVDEFSSFSRMPQAVLIPENLSEICRQVLFLEQNRGTGIELNAELPETDVNINCDSRQVSRALTNIVKNAAESVAERIESEGEKADPGRIRFAMTQQETLHGLRTTIVVEDNGTGLPVTDLTRLTEPYVTTRAKGTGLGLAIVKKIMEDHSGDLVLENRREGGARVVLTFPPHDAATDTQRPDTHHTSANPARASE